MSIYRYSIKITGIVQGVGFRPFVYNLAKSLYLNGWVSNAGSNVIIDVEGEKDSLESFLAALKNGAPPLSRIKSIEFSECLPAGCNDFEIRKSTGYAEDKVFISNDVAVCDDCLRELFDRNDRRYLYPFINCTNCGPRFTIVKGVPYDRERTTMSVFPMCPKCREEYTDPGDRRYHAQPVSCRQCGPRLCLTDNSGNIISDADPINYARELLINGKILAVKGLGGYHLACNALDGNAVLALRKRKIREDKPFAVMVKDYAAALKFCYINDSEKRLLESEKSPIVLLRKREDVHIPGEIAPGNPYLGIMLPYTPVHHLLFHQPDIHEGKGVYGEKQVEMVVMTSGNRSNEPIYFKDEEALENLKDIADYFLSNDRDIFIHTDDSVTRVFRDREYPIRRSRGYVPLPLTCGVIGKTASESSPRIPSVLACGGELKSTFCLNIDEEFYMSHHIGDLENAETLESFEDGIEHFKGILGIRPDIVACDLHPDYLSTKYALSIQDIKKVRIQHHHAHIASCMAENNLSEEVIGVAFDGTGYGEDGHIWGGEFFTGTYGSFKRAGHLEYVEMPGGELAIREPWRMALSWLNKAGIDLRDCTGSFGRGALERVLPEGIGHDKLSILYNMIKKGINCPLTSSAGRLFDAVSALLGIMQKINYEGQAAVELENIVKDCVNLPYSFGLAQTGGLFIVECKEIFKEIVRDIDSGIEKAIIASRFHETAAGIIMEGCISIRKDTGIEKVVLSGGVFQNMTLLERAVHQLETEGFHVYTHSSVPANDGGIALGQAVTAVVSSLR